MARMLEALKQAGKPILRIAEMPPPPVRGLRALSAELPAPPPDAPSPLPISPGAVERGRGEGEETVSYIEVGGRDEPIDASADVLACGTPPAHTVARASPVVEKRVPEPSTCPPVPKTTTIKFRPLQAEIVTLAPGPARFAPELVAFHRPHDPAAEQYTKLLAILESQLPAGPKRALYFTAATREAGTTTTSLNLAIVLARCGTARVVVIDANQRHPAVAERLGLRAVPGLAEVLAGGVALHQVLQETSQPNLHVVTAGRTRPAVGLRLSGGSFGALLHQLRERYDWILIDAANWDGSPETVAVSSACDAVYLVLRAAEEETADVANLLRAIPQQGSRLKGCIVTQTI